ncbi:MAG: RloB family protein [Limnohabitans sp.]|nr:RloB family protein [Limnohabitans sp.]
MERKRFKIQDYNKREAFEDATRFFIVYEGDKELHYFQMINHLYLPPKKASIIHILEKDTVIGSQPKKLIERVKFFIENPPKDLSVTPTEDDKFRFVLDVDDHPKEQFPELNKYCKDLKDANLYISNFCFEVWQYLHLDEAHKIKSNTSAEMKTEVGAKHTESKMKNFPKSYLEKDRIEKAIERAKIADTNKNDFFPVEKSTKVYLLMEELLNYSTLNKEVNNPEIV